MVLFISGLVAAVTAAAVGTSVAAGAGAFSDDGGIDEGDAEEAALRRRRAARGRGRQGTIFAGPRGVSEQDQGLLTRPTLTGPGGPGGL